MPLETTLKHSQVQVGGAIELHVAELGSGKPVLFCHGFPDLWRGWQPQMKAVAAAGYRAIALDMRGYGRSSAPADPLAYTPLHTVVDLVGLIDALGLDTVTVVGHDFGASVAWNAALMRPDRFTAVFGMSVPFMPRGETSFLDALRAAGRDDFYMFAQMKPEADALWADAAVTVPAMLYRLSGSPPLDAQWSPFDPVQKMTQPAPRDPDWTDPDDVAYLIAEYQRTGFHGGLNYYRSISYGFDLTAAFKGAVVRQPSFFLVGERDGLNRIRPSTEAALRQFLPGLRGFVSLPSVGHWPQREAAAAVCDALLGFLGGLDRVDDRVP